ncbi:hypothetical protein MTO96_027862 [Rhipicephalus appendiculatus]
MEYTMEGHDLDPSELNDGSWKLALDMQKKIQTPDRDCVKPDQRSDYADNRNCKYRFITKKQPRKPVAADAARGWKIHKPVTISTASEQGTTTKDKTVATWKSESKECNRGDYRSRSESFSPLRRRSESRGDRSQSRPRGDRSSESRGDRSTSRPPGDRLRSRTRGDRSSSSRKQATSKGRKSAPQPRAKKSPQDSQVREQIKLLQQLLAAANNEV